MAFYKPRRETSEGIIQAITLILELQYEKINLKSPSQYFAVADDESHLPIAFNDLQKSP